jgi:hypothetical protein
MDTHFWAWNFYTGVKLGCLGLDWSLLSLEMKINYVCVWA